MARPLLSPSYEKDNIGKCLAVECGSLKGRLYVAKMDSTKCGVGKCIFFDGKWLTPSEFESSGKEMETAIAASRKVNM